MKLDQTSLSDFEATLRGFIVDEKSAKPPRLKGQLAPNRWRLPSVFQSLAKLPVLARERRGDLTVAALGISLCLCCAMFPWYIVLNPEKFGVWNGLTFAGNEDPRTGISTENAGRIGLPSGLPTLAQDGGIDTLTTGTTADDEHRLTPAPDQPFPGEEIKFSLVYAANGRAMIADDSGMYIVERGSMLPDDSTVASIEQRDGKWVLVTSDDKIIPLAQP